MRTTTTLFFGVLVTAGFAAARTCANCPTSIVMNSGTLALRGQAQNAEEESRVCGYSNSGDTSETACGYDDYGKLVFDLTQDEVCPEKTTTYTSSSCIELD
ncbi:hypothetical protein FIBSPDRAFT_298468 [Athelia psychrophila]|uniref:Uncharacterized protein n=1 Tax=Athelia psychrophila TaxID=1759441 RepID=A0A166QUE5_9AGAM|nr:hypothetical protein FIBSPDRAFT_298468 [Fibularhizoctonia sp. CBS 109695]